MLVTIGQITPPTAKLKATPPKSSQLSNKENRTAPISSYCPEVSVQGYTSLDWFLDRDLERCALQPLEKIIAAPKESRRCWHRSTFGLITGRRLYNAAAVIRNRELLGFADKTLLPEYDVFDDPRYFQPSAERHLFSFQGHKLGVAVCEDFWNDKTFWRERLYTNDPADELIELGAEYLVSINASPFNKGKMGQRCAMVSHRAKTASTVIFVNLVGRTTGHLRRCSIVPQ